MKFTKERFITMAKASEVVEQLVADWMNARTCITETGTFQRVDDNIQRMGVLNGWHIPDLERASDGKLVEVKEDLMSARTGNIALEKNCMERMIDYVEANGLNYPLMCSVNHKEFSILFFKMEGLMDKLDDLVRQGKCRLIPGGDRDEMNYVLSLSEAKKLCDFYDGMDFPKYAKPLLDGRKNPKY